MDNKEIKKRIAALRERMTAVGGDICLITDNDPHISEYVGDHYKVREFFSGFTGSAGTLVAGLKEAWLFTDGRYFVQAERELAGTGISLMKSGTEGVLTPIEFIRQLTDKAVQNSDVISADSQKLRKPGADPSKNGGMSGAVVLTDGSLLRASDGKELSEYDNIELWDDFDPAEDIWTDRPARAETQIYPLDIKYAGESAESKLGRIRGKIKEAGCAYHIIASLEDIAWTLNLRGGDIPCTPVFEAFLVIGEETVLFVNENALSENAVKCLATAKVSTQSYDSIYDYAGRMDAGSDRKVLIDRQRVNHRIISSLPQSAVKFVTNPTLLMRAVKNDTEIKNLRNVHEDDGLCVTRLMYMVKCEMDRNDPWTEADAADFIDSLREEISDYVSLSFPTISAAGANAAMMHYSFDREDCALLKEGSMLLVDSGGQYLRGTTDVTRTFALGNVTFEEKKAYTLALKGLLALTDAVFLKGTSGYGLDIIARQFLWREGMDYRCGTGHGVGYMLNVHEGPNAFRYRYVPGVSDYCELEQGMVTTVEPGVYEEGKFGIRIENELLCVNAFENEYGQFMKFDTLTLVPFDRDLILKEMLTEHETGLIDGYHKKVYDVLSLKMSRDELEFLKEYTAAL